MEKETRFETKGTIQSYTDAMYIAKMHFSDMYDEFDLSLSSYERALKTDLWVDDSERLCRLTAKCYGVHLSGGEGWYDEMLWIKRAAEFYRDNMTRLYERTVAASYMTEEERIGCDMALQAARTYGGMVLSSKWFSLKTVWGSVERMIGFER